MGEAEDRQWIVHVDRRHCRVTLLGCSSSAHHAPATRSRLRCASCTKSQRNGSGPVRSADAVATGPGIEDGYTWMFDSACEILTHEPIAQTAAKLSARGIELPTFASPTVPGVDLGDTDRVYATHHQRMLDAQVRRLPSFIEEMGE